MLRSKLFIVLFLSLLVIAANYANHTTSSLSSDAIDLNGYEIDPGSPAAFKVVIDPGHGGIDVGAIGASGRFEKDLTLTIAQKAAQRLEQEPQIEVLLTRTDDRHLSQESRSRPNYANEQHADLYISIHGNTFSDPEVTGTETYYYDRPSRDAAKTLQRHVAAATGFRDRGIRKEELYVLKDTEMPAALVEIGYLTNPADEALMWSEIFQDRTAEAIAEAIKEIASGSL